MACSYGCTGAVALLPLPFLRKLLKPKCLPVLLTYESDCVASHTTVCDAFNKQLKEEIAEIVKRFTAEKLPDIRIHLFLVPLHDKQTLVGMLHQKLEGMQR